MSRRIVLITAGICLALTGTWYLFLWSPQSGALDKARTRTAVAESSQQRLRTQLQGLQKAKLTLPDTQAKVAALRAAIPDAPQLDHLLSTINDAAKASGVELTAMAPAPIADKSKSGTVPGVSEINVTISVNGAYAQIIDFVNRLNSSARLVVIDKVAMAGQPADKDKGARVITQLAGRMFMTGAK